MDSKKLLKEVRDFLRLYTLIDESGQCEAMVEKIDKAFETEHTDTSELAKFCKLISEQHDCPPEFQEIVNKEFWNLIDNKESKDEKTGLPTRMVCFFKLKEGKFLAEDGTEITTNMLVKYPHMITETWSYIVLD